MDQSQQNGLGRLASVLSWASEKLDAGGSLEVEEVRTLSALRAAAPREPRIPLAHVLAASAGFLLLVSWFFVSGFFALYDVLRSRGGGDAPILLAMMPAAGTRAGGGWQEGDPFVLGVKLPEELHVLILHMDAGGRLDLVFPFHDATTGTWSYLGHASSRLPGGSPVSIPAAGFPMNLLIEGGGPGEEAFLAIAGPEAIDEAEILKLVDELRRVVEGARGTGGEAIAERVRSVLAGRAGRAFGLLRYRVGSP